MKMEYAFEVIRGWPQDGALDRVEPIKTGVAVKNGDFVEKQADGTVALTSATATGKAGVVIQGNGDSSSAATTGKALVLWSNYIARASSSVYAAGSYAPGADLTVISGKLALAGSTDPVIGSVLDVISEDNSLVILVK